jgi:hypothetical protein
VGLRGKGYSAVRSSGFGWGRLWTSLVNPNSLSLNARASLAVPGIGVGSGVSRGPLQRGQKNASGLSPQGSYLVDPASSHMLVSKIKPCMSKYKLFVL